MLTRLALDETLVPDGENSEQRPSRTQRLVTRLMRGRVEEMERQSREWFVVCPNCGLERTYWDIGGVRYKARSRGKPLAARRAAQADTRHASRRAPAVGSGSQQAEL